MAGALKLQTWWLVGRFTDPPTTPLSRRDITTIAPKVRGFIKTVAVIDNQPVHVGDLLATIDDRDYRAELAKAEATVDEQTATLANLDALASLQAATIEQAHAKVDSATAENQRAKSDAERSRSLVGRKVVSTQDFELIDAAATKARADVAGANAALVAIERQMAVIETQKQQATAGLARAKAGVDLARLDLADTEIRSPIEGIVGNRRARIGDYATIGVQLMSIVPSAGLYVEANFKESQIAYMREGQPVFIEAEVLRDEKFTGKVVSLAPATGAKFSLLPAENATGNFTKIVQRVPVRIRLDGDASELGRLRPGLSVIASVDQR